jgi:phenylpyruvate tautomerase PptA (4-oxalocrotonate tautomerase family)
MDRKRRPGGAPSRTRNNAGRTLDRKKALYARIAELLAQEPGIRPENVLIKLVECAKEDWSFGNGIVAYAS